MSKAILVMDMPSSCNKCHLLDELYDLCIPMDEYVSDYCSETRPDWCPLKPMPQRANHPDWCDGGRYDKGYNACIDEILGDKE